jgi:hypothetical protein
MLSMLILSLLPAVALSHVPVETVNPVVLLALNATVGGRLQTAKPVSAPCYSTFNGKYVGRDEAACAAVTAGYTTPTFRVERFGAYQVSAELTSISYMTYQFYSWCDALIFFSSSNP